MGDVFTGGAGWALTGVGLAKEKPGEDDIPCGLVAATSN